MPDAHTLDRDDAMLARIAELDLSLAEKLHACAMAADAPGEIASLARAYQKTARSLRQSLALKARLKRDLATDARQTPAPHPDTAQTDAETDARIARRIDIMR